MAVHSDASPAVPSACGNSSLYQDLTDAICLLASLTQVAPTSAASSNPIGTGIESLGCEDTVEVGSSLGDPVDLEAGKLGDHFEADSEDVYLRKLKDELVDRLSETLARFKSPPKSGSLDAKHVSSVIMIEHAGNDGVTFLCAKNEGLDGQDKEDFLPKWKNLMERAAQLDESMADANFHDMLRLVIHQQKQRIDYYVNAIGQALKAIQADGHDDLVGDCTLKNKPLSSPQDRFRMPGDSTVVGLFEWVDDHGQRYCFRHDDSPVTKAYSAMASGRSDASNITTQIDQVFCLAQKLSDRTPSSETRWLNDMECLMRNTLNLWRTNHGQVALSSRIRHLFKTHRTQGKVFHDSILFLTRIFYSVEVFLEAARKVKGSHSISYIAVPYHDQPEGDRPEHANTVLKILARLRFPVQLISRRMLTRIERNLPTLREQNRRARHIHAELQALYHLDILFSDENGTYTVHPYVGCSRRCCFLCNAFIRSVYPNMRVRGDHNAVMHRWEPQRYFPTAAQRDKFELGVQSILQMLKAILQKAFSAAWFQQEHPLAQSSHGLPSILREELAKMEPTHIETKRMMMFLHNSVDDGILITPDHQKPGFATVCSGRWKSPREMTVSDAEELHINFLREKEGLERIDAMPPVEAYRPRICFCKHRSARFRCSACHTSYCGKKCQTRDWKSHVFVCRVQGRPNAVDYLKWFLRKYAPTNGQVPDTVLMKQLFADDDLCCTFGFNHCLSSAEVSHLVRVFKQALRSYSSKAIQQWVDSQSLQQHLYQFVSQQSTRCDDQTKHAFQWYLDERTLPQVRELSVYGVYLHHILSLEFTKAMLALPQDVADWRKLPPKQAMVVQLYTKLWQPINNIPTPLDQEWLLFGFCHCRTDLQRQQLRAAYLQLVATQVPLEHIAECLGPQELTHLMESKKVDISTLLGQGIFPGPPGPHEVGAYRLVAEVHHALSGRFCSCFRRCACPSGFDFFKNESNISIESEIQFGFHGTEAWERWQLLNFYAHVFSLPTFDLREMQAATEKGCLEKYLEGLIPDFRRQIYCKYRTSLMFPRLGAKLALRDSDQEVHLADYSVMHDVVHPLGLSNPLNIHLEEHRLDDDETS